MSGAFDDFSMRDLFRIEARTQTQALVAGLLALESDPRRADQLEVCMRAAHSLKGAANLVDIGAGVIIAHAMEELFVAAQEGRIVLNREQIDMLLKGVDLLNTVGSEPVAEQGEDDDMEIVAERYVNALAKVMDDGDSPSPVPEKSDDVLVPKIIEARAVDATVTPASNVNEPTLAWAEPVRDTSSSERIMRVSADNLNRLLDLAGESLVESRRLSPLTNSFQRLKRLQQQAAASVDTLREKLAHQRLSPDVEIALANSERALLACRQYLTERMTKLEEVEHQATVLAHRLYDQALMVRMRPFSDGLSAYPRMVRDTGHSLGKQARLEIVGANTQVDRDILERLDAPLGHLLRNALDHGVETPEARIAAGKSAEGVVRISAHHSAGTLQISVTDDGAGIDLELIRGRVIARKLVDEQNASRLSSAELLEFLFLPGFTMKEEVSRISGRGVGLDVVRDMVKQVGGVVTISSEIGQGTGFHLQLPLTLSVIRALLVEIAGEPYAFSFGQVLRANKIARKDVETTEGRQFFEMDGRKVGLVAAHQVLGYDSQPPSDDMMSVVVIGGLQGSYGVVVDRFLGAQELVVQPLDTRLGKIKDISAGALMEDGSPLLIIDAEDMVQSMDKLAMSDRLGMVRQGVGEAGNILRRKRVLVVDDSFTVRELQRKLLVHHGYDVELAVDGMEGWNLIRGDNFDLVVTDVDMPRMDGIELVSLIKNDPKLNGIPVMILSYKDREDDRQRGLEAGADYYLTKGSYQSDALIEAVFDLIGPAQP